MAMLAVEVNVHVVKVLPFLTTMASTGADGIFYRTRTIINSMDEVMREKECDTPEYGRLVDTLKLFLQTLQREGILAAQHRAKNEYAHRCGLNLALLEH